MSGTRAWVALGSNLGDRRAHLDGAVEALRCADGVEVLRVSPWIETAPVGGPPGQGPYLNGCLEVETALDVHSFHWLLARIESQFGRDRSREVRHGPRTLDLDLLLFGDLALTSVELVVPHPRLEERPFVLEPLCALAPDLCLPASGRTVRERLAQLRQEAGRSAPGLRAGLPPVLDPAGIVSWSAERRRGGERIGFIPTMGALHEGHATLVRRARAENEAVCVSIFVNPLQFDDPRDFERYPRDLEQDRERLAQEGCDLVLTGTLAQFFPEARGGRPAARDPGPDAPGLEGEFRPGHFAGVATICARLFELVRPMRAYFGEKDYQQCRVVQHVARTLGEPEIVVCPTSRDDDGLARSSRNQLLATGERERALVLSRALFAARAAWRAGERRAERLEELLRAALEVPGVAPEYAVVRDPARFTEPARGALTRARALVAARVGPVRLIDNLELGAASEGGARTG
jgi:pantoate--beta-alanine ligase